MITFTYKIEEKPDGLSFEGHAIGTATKMESGVADFIGEILPQLVRSYMENAGAICDKFNSTTYKKPIPPDENKPASPP